MDYKQKYLKYKYKYINLKNQIGGTITDIEKKTLMIDLCVSFVTEIIGDMYQTLKTIKDSDFLSDIQLLGENKTTTKIYMPININIDKQEIQQMAIDISNNYINIKDIQIKRITDRNKLYKDLFFFEKMNNDNYYVKNPDSKLSTNLNPTVLINMRNNLINIEADIGSHWFYIDDKSHIHNSYTYNMQLNHSHQFCQTHSLLMALHPKFRRICIDTSLATNGNTDDFNNRLCAYKSILNLLTIILCPIIKNYIELNKPITNSPKRRKIEKNHFQDIITEILNTNLKGELPYKHDFIKDYLENFLYLSTETDINKRAQQITQNILTILYDTDAFKTVPNFYST